MRLILIDNGSGYIFGDTADLPPHTFAGEEFPVTEGQLMEPIDARRAARWVDEAVVGAFGRRHEFLPRAPGDTGAGYHVHRADAGGSDAVPVVWDGQDSETVAAVERDCQFIGHVAIRDADAGAGAA